MKRAKLNKRIERLEKQYEKVKPACRLIRLKIQYRLVRLYKQLERLDENN